MLTKENSHLKTNNIEFDVNLLPFVDVDGTLLDYDGPLIIYCDFLITWLNQHNIKEIVLLTNMNMREVYYLHPSRHELIQYLVIHQIKVKHVVTPLDVIFTDLKITKKMGDLYAKYFHPIEAALANLKHHCGKELFHQFFTQFTSLFYRQLKENSCQNFKPIFEACIDNMKTVDLSEKQVSLLRAMAQEFFIYNIIYHQFQIDVRSTNKGEAHVRYIRENSDFLANRPIVFIDDTEKERTSVYHAHQKAFIRNLLLVVPPPSDHQNQVTQRWERVHQHSANQYAPQQQFSAAISQFCQISFFKVNSQNAYTLKDLQDNKALPPSDDMMLARDGSKFVVEL